MHNLPSELIAQLSKAEKQRTNGPRGAILHHLSQQTSNVDQLLIAVYRETNQIMKRTNIVSLLYRMTLSGDISPVPGRRGWYQIKESQWTNNTNCRRIEGGK